MKLELLCNTYESTSGERVLRRVLRAVVGGAGALRAESSSDLTMSDTFSAILFIGERVVPPSLL